MTRDLHEGYRLWPLTQCLAAERGPATLDATMRASGCSGKISNQEPATSRADPEAGP